MHTPTPWKAEYGYAGSARRLFITAPNKDGKLVEALAAIQFSADTQIARGTRDMDLCWLEQISHKARAALAEAEGGGK